MSVTPTAAATICSVAATTSASADPSPVTTAPASAAPSANDPTFSPTALVNTCP
jgi:hypothetical protein